MIEMSNTKINDPKYTHYEEVYEVFLRMVDSYDFGQMDDDELKETLYGYLDMGRLVFSTYISKDFYDDVPEEERFNFKLSRAEMTILAMAMKLEWVREHKHSEELMRKSIGDRDYAAVQGYQYLEKLQAMENQLEKDIDSRINRIEYANQGLYGDMK